MTPVENFLCEPPTQRIVFGWGCIEDAPAEVDRFSARRVLVVGERSTKAIVDDLAGRLGPRVAGIIPEVRPHVPGEDVDEGRRQAAGADVDLIVTIGGGSATGLGKAIVVEHAAPVLAIPTTYAGSEVTPIYGITASGRKHTGRDEGVLPKTVVYDPALTTSLPPRVTATSGMNALAHCVEALYAESGGALPRTVALEAIAVLRRALPACIADPESREGRAGALYGAYLAGTVLATTGMAIHHRICHVLGGSFGINHGDANAVVLPHAVAFNQPAVPDAMEAAAKALGGADAASAVFELAVSLGAPTSLRDLGLKRTDLEEAASLVVQDPFYNPRPVAVADALAILEAAFEGMFPTAATRKGRGHGPR